MPKLSDLAREDYRDKLNREMTHQPFSSPIPQGVVDYAREVGGRIANPANTLRSVIDRMKEQPADEMAMDWANPVAGMAGIFAGKGAKTANLAMLAKAEELAKSGVPDEAIWKQTGWTLNTPDKMPRFEIPDNSAMYRGTYPSAYGYADTAIHHPELMKLYPDVGGIRIENNLRGRGGEYVSTENSISGIDEAIRLGDDGADTGSTALHELQHAIQQREGFAKGGNTNSVEIMNESSRDRSNEINKILNSGSYKDMKEYDALRREKMDLINSAELSPFDAYQRLAGEAEARLTQSRMAMTPEERLAQYPYQPDYFQKATGVPLSDLIVRMK